MLQSYNNKVLAQLYQKDIIFKKKTDNFNLNEINFLLSKYLMYLCTRFEKGISGCSAVRLAHLLWEQGVVGSNPATPTDKNQGVTVKCSSFFVARLGGCIGST